MKPLPGSNPDNAGFGVGLGLAVEVGPQHSNGHVGPRGHEPTVKVHHDFAVEPESWYPDTFEAAAVAGAGTLLLLPPTSPVEGYLWIVTNWQVTGALVTDTQAGIAYVFRGAHVPRSTSSAALHAGGASYKDGPSCSLPWSQFYSNRQLVVRAGERLWAIVTTPTNGEAYEFHGDILVERDPRSHTDAKRF